MKLILSRNHQGFNIKTLNREHRTTPAHTESSTKRQFCIFRKVTAANMYGPPIPPRPKQGVRQVLTEPLSEGKMSSSRAKSNTHQPWSRYATVSMSKLNGPNGKRCNSSWDANIVKGELDPQG